ncbi:uncharacterized protein LOC142465485, partial [Ascaphus truei]|uniref:uncharacterized protein LOC142465485 n=1 Tax=Ascaphus truei TaxID=8439 RepID=UPI003F597DAA
NNINLKSKLKSYLCIFGCCVYLDSLTDSGGLKYFKCFICFRFRCSNCGRRWASLKVHLVFYMKLVRTSTGQVTMNIFKQKCNKCNDASYEYPTFDREKQQDILTEENGAQFDRENIEIVINMLVTRIRIKCYGEQVEDEPKRRFITDGRPGGPHDDTNCEACTLGISRCGMSSNFAETKPMLAQTKPKAQMKPKAQTKPKAQMKPKERQLFTPPKHLGEYRRAAPQPVQSNYWLDSWEREVARRLEENIDYSRNTPPQAQESPKAKSRSNCCCVIM